MSWPMTTNLTFQPFKIMFKVSHLVSTKDYSAEKDKHKRSVELVFEAKQAFLCSLSISSALLIAFHLPFALCRELKRASYKV